MALSAKISDNLKEYYLSEDEEEDEDEDEEGEQNSEEQGGEDCIDDEISVWELYK